MAHGAALPLMLLFFGDLTNVFFSQSATIRIAEALQAAANDSILDINCTANYTFMGLTGTITELVQMQLPQSSCLLGDEFLQEINLQTYAFLGIGVSVFLLAYIQISFYQTAAERQVYKIRLQYYRAVLRQNIAWFDANPTGEISTRLSE
jgi:ABC-type multidrug transport system fused ATPase/permease subunit